MAEEIRVNLHKRVVKCSFWIYREPGGDYFYDTPGKHSTKWFYDYHYGGGDSAFNRVQKLNESLRKKESLNNGLSPGTV